MLVAVVSALIPAFHDTALAAGTALVGAIAAALLFALFVLSAFRMVPRDERLVVFRRGRPARVKGPGVVVLPPGIDRCVRVPLRQLRVDALRVEATTKDGVTVTVNGAARLAVRDVVRYAEAAESPVTAAGCAAEAEIRRFVTQRHLVELSDADDDPCELAVRVSGRTDECGVEVTCLDMSRIDVRLKADLIRWAERFDGRTRRAGHAP